MKVGIVFSKQLKHCLLAEFVAELTAHAVRQLLVHLVQQFICCSPAELHLLAADIKPLKVEHGRVLISHLDLDLRHRSSGRHLLKISFMLL